MPRVHPRHGGLRCARRGRASSGEGTALPPGRERKRRNQTFVLRPVTRVTRVGPNGHKSTIFTNDPRIIAARRAFQANNAQVAPTTNHNLISLSAAGP